MTISIDYGATNVITVELSDLSLVGGTLYTHDTNAFRLALLALEASEEGIVFPTTNTHNTEVTVGGITYARTFEIVTPYSIEYPDVQASTRLEGSNNNVWDIQAGILNQNQMQVIPTNSAGLITVISGSGLSVEQAADLELIRKLLSNRVVVSSDDSTTTIYDDDGTTVLHTFTHSDVRNREPV